MTTYQQEYQRKLTTVEACAERVQNHDRIYTMHSVQISVPFLDALYDRKDELEDVTVMTSTAFENFKILRPDAEKTFRYQTTFLGAPDRAAMKTGRTVDNICYQLGRLKEVVDEFKPQVVVMMVTPMDEDGYFNMGCAANECHCAIPYAREVILQVNRCVPYINSPEHKVHISDVTALFEKDEALTPLVNAEPKPEDKTIAEYILDRIPNGATLQIGIGGVPNSIAYNLVNHRHLGVHTELFTESLMHLMKMGVVDNSCKEIDTGVTCMAFGYGSRELFDFMDHNPKCITRPHYYVNNPYVIGQISNFVSVNTCMGCDITGQIASESIGPVQYSNTGGQLDFIRGATISRDGQSFLCMHSVANKKDGSRISKISFSLEPGTVVTVPRTDVMYLVTEYGVADLRNKTRIQRTKAIINIAHPEFRDELTFQAKKAGYLSD